jgi:hypothetical protein
LTISSRKLELSISSTRLFPAFIETSFLEATNISLEPSARERNILTTLKTPRFWLVGLLASNLAEAILISFTWLVFDPWPVIIWSKLLAELVAESVVPVLDVAGIISVAV